MSPFARSFDSAQYDPEHFDRGYRRGLEAMREMTFDDDVDDDDLVKHQDFQKREPGLLIITERKLF